MEYERIHKPPPRQGGGFSVSPKKIRSMLLGCEKRHKEEEEGEQPTTTDQEISQSKEISQSENRRATAVDCEDMECSTSVSMSISNSSGPEQSTRVGPTLDEDSFDSDSVSFGFEFQKPGPTPAPAAAAPIQRFTMVQSFLPPFSKPAPSKWDDAEKWISSPNLNAKGNGRMNTKVGLMVNKVVVVNGKKVDLSKVKKLGVVTSTGFGLGKATAQRLRWSDEPFGLMDLTARDGGFGAANPVIDSAASVNPSNLPELNQLKPIYDAPLAPELRAVSMRDTGTEMTPIPSQEPSRSTTPVRPTTPTCDSPNPATSAGVVSEMESKMETRREIMELSEQLGKANIAAWASRAVREGETPNQSSKINKETRGVDWEEAEKSKYLARFKRNEARIQAWENHQKAKIEAQMQKIEVDLEKIRARKQEKLLNKLAASKRKANQKRAAAEAKCQKEAMRTTKQADHIKQTGHVPNQPFSCWSWCF